MWWLERDRGKNKTRNEKKKLKQAIIDQLPCPPRCRTCQQVCPSKAFDDQGEFHRMKCLAHTIKHAIYPLALKDEKGLQYIERVINTAGYDYWIDCSECLKVCPLNKPQKG